MTCSMSSAVVSHDVTKRTLDSFSPRGPQYSKVTWGRRRSMTVLGRVKNCWLVGESMNGL